MSKKQFTLDSWLKDKSQKVVTRCGFPVRIVCTDVKRKDYPILALVERDDQEEYQSFTKDGRFSLYNPLHDNFDLFIETADEVSEDEKVRKEIVGFLDMFLGTHITPTATPKQLKGWIAWLENIQYTIDHEKREGFHLGYKACHEEQSEQKPIEENKGNIGGISPKWSEKDEQHIDSLLKRLDALCRNKFERTRFAISEDRDWLKSLRPQNRWKPSDEQIKVCKEVYADILSAKGFDLGTVVSELNRLEEGLKKKGE